MRIHNAIINNITKKHSTNQKNISFGQHYPNIDTYVPDNSSSRAQERALPALPEANTKNIKFLPVKTTIVNGQPVVLLKKVKINGSQNQ